MCFSPPIHPLPPSSSTQKIQIGRARSRLPITSIPAVHSFRPDEFSKDAAGWEGTQKVMKTVGFTPPYGAGNKRNMPRNTVRVFRRHFYQMQKYIVVPTKAEIQSVPLFLINSCSFSFSDAHFLGHNNGKIVIVPDKFL